MFEELLRTFEADWAALTPECRQTIRDSYDEYKAHSPGGLITAKIWAMMAMQQIYMVADSEELSIRALKFITNSLDK